MFGIVLPVTNLVANVRAIYIVEVITVDKGVIYIDGAMTPAAAPTPAARHHRAHGHASAK